MQLKIGKYMTCSFYSLGRRHWFGKYEQWTNTLGKPALYRMIFGPIVHTKIHTVKVFFGCEFNLAVLEHIM